MKARYNETPVQSPDYLPAFQTIFRSLLPVKDRIFDHFWANIKTSCYRIIVSVIIASFITCLGAFRADSANLSSVSVVPVDRIPYVSMVELAEAFRLKIDYNPLINSLTVKRGAKTLTLQNRSRFAQCNGATVNMMAPSCLVHGALYAPASTVLPLFSTLLNGSIRWDERVRAVITEGMTGSVRSVSFEERTQGTLIRIELAESLACKDTLQSINGQRWLHLRLEDGIFDPDSLTVMQPVGMVRSLRTFPGNGELIVSFLVSDDMENYDVTRGSRPHELLISLRRKRLNTIASLAEKPPEPVASIPVEPNVNGDLWVIDTIVIDPGHGGIDPGAVGPGGTQEKDVVLAIAKELKKIADKQKEVKVILTRDTDVFVPLHERARTALKSGKLFVSIHANATKSKNVSGIEVYFLSDAKTEDAKRVAERENAVIAFEDNPQQYAKMFDNNDISKELKEIQFDMVSNVFLKESQSMCSILLDTTVSSTRQENRGVKQAGFLVMRNTQAVMPSVLFEVGFISNPKEEKMLRLASHQKRIAASIYEAVILFKKGVERDLFTVSRSQ
ncbi:N-acetylmuramoyl-L-alanine amidase [bacterium]|nr:N-acetylmuramoyl-L-alanine amidase [bacterium]